MSDAIIETFELRKSFGKVQAVNGLNLTVPRGSICGFMGRNGAGKTTTMKMLLGMLKPSSGAGTVFGRPINLPEESLEIRRRTGFVSEDKGLYDYLTVQQMIDFTRSFFPTWRKELAKGYQQSFDLPLNRKIKALSKGMRSKLAALLALSHGAELLILDEPTDGLDPVAIEEILQALVTQVAAEGTTVFLSSHRISELEQIVDCLRFIDGGRVVLEGSLDELKENFRRIQLVFPETVPEPLPELQGLERVRKEGRVLSLVVSRNADAIVRQFHSFNPVSVDVVPLSLKEIFLETVRDKKPQP